MGKFTYSVWCLGWKQRPRMGKGVGGRRSGRKHLKTPSFGERGWEVGGVGGWWGWEVGGVGGSI